MHLSPHVPKAEDGLIRVVWVEPVIQANGWVFQSLQLVLAAEFLFGQQVEDANLLAGEAHSDLGGITG